MDCEFILKTTTLAGKILLESCAEISRVEDTISRMCEAYNMNNVNAYVTPSGIFVSVDYKGKTYSRVVRVKGNQLSLDKIHQVNAISRKATASYVPVEKVFEELTHIDTNPTYSKVQKYIACGIIGSCFTLFFGGNIIDAINAFFVGVLVMVVQLYLDENKINDMIKTMVLSGFVTLLSLIAVYIGFAQHKDPMIAGNIMQLLPGLSMTNAIRDMMSGDLLSGMIRICDVAFTAIGLALGTVIVLGLWMSFIGGVA